MSYPDTPLVREALAITRGALPPSIIGHSLRTYMLAEAYAVATRRAHDEEGLCLAAVFHDVGLAVGRRPGQAFTLASSAALAAFLEERHVPASRVAPLAEAIELHMQLVPRWSRGNVVGLLQVGAWMDATGLRRGRIAAEAARVAALVERGGFDAEFRRMLFATLSPRACFGLLFPRPERASGPG